MWSPKKTMIKNKAIFLDRDGVINKICYHPELKDVKKKICKDPLNIEEFNIVLGVQEAIEKFKKSGYKVVIISNQPGLIKGFYQKELLDSINKLIREKLNLKHIYYCLHHPDYTGDCSCRKPKPGLLLKAAQELNINLKESFMVGDQESDIIAGKEAGCKTVYIGEKNVQSTYTIRKINDLLEILNS